MANSGLKRVITLRKYVNGIATNDTKENIKGTEGYIPDVFSEESCPSGCDAVVSGTILIQGTTTTTTSTTTTTKSPYVDAVDYSIKNYDQSNYLVIQYSDVTSSTQTEALAPNTVTPITSTTTPRRISGTTSYSIEATGAPYEVTTTTTTAAPITAVDYLIDTTAETQSVIIELTQLGQSETVEAEINPGYVYTVASDTTPTIISGGASTTINPAGDNYYEIDTTPASSDTTIEYTPGGSLSTTTQDYPAGNVYILGSDTTPTISAGDPSTLITLIGTEYTPQQDTYTVLNNSYYNTSEVKYREYGGISEIVEVSPREELTLTSQDTPIVFSGITDVTITASGSTSQPSSPIAIAERNCYQYDILNQGISASTLGYLDCNREDQEVTVDPGDTVSIPSVSTPTVVSGSTNVTITNTLAPGLTITPSITTTTTTTRPIITTTTTQAVNVANVTCDSFEYINTVPSTSEAKDAALWFPLTITGLLGKADGDFVFTETRGIAFPVLYRIYDGTTLIFDKCFFDYSGLYWRDLAYNAFLYNGFTESQATSYSTKQNDISPSSGITSKVVSQLTSHTITKVTNSKYVTIQIYSPVTESLMNETFDGHSGAEYRSGFTITCP